MDSYLRKPLEKLFQAPSHFSVLRVLYPLKEGLSGREIARRANINDRNCRLILKRLELLGLVFYQGSGRVRLYQLNRKHFFVEHFLAPLFNNEPKLLDGIKEQLKGTIGELCLWMGIFGSTAKGEDTVESDLDILVLVKNEEQQEILLESLDELEGKLHEMYGVALSPIVMTIKEWRKTNRSFRDTKADIIAHHITLVGDDTIL